MLLYLLSCTCPVLGCCSRAPRYREAKGPWPSIFLPSHVMGVTVPSRPSDVFGPPWALNSVDMAWLLSKTNSFILLTIEEYLS